MPSGRLVVGVIEARGLPKKDLMSKNDPYCIVRLSHSSGPRQTKVLVNAGANPKWHEEFRFDVSSLDFQTLVLSADVLDKDKFSADDHIGSVEVPLSAVLSKSSFNAWHKLRNKRGKSAGEIHLEIVFRPIQQQHQPQPAAASPYPQPSLQQYSHQTTPYPGAYPAHPPQSGHYPGSGPQSGHYNAPPAGYQQPPPHSGYQQTPPHSGYHQPPPHSGYHQPPQTSGYHQPPPQTGYHQQPPHAGYHQPPPPTSGYQQPPSQPYSHPSAPPPPASSSNPSAPPPPSQYGAPPYPR